MHNLACLLIPQEIFPQSARITDMPLLRLFLMIYLVYTIQACAIFAQIYEMSGLSSERVKYFYNFLALRPIFNHEVT